MPSGRVHSARFSNCEPRYAWPSDLSRTSPPSVRIEPPGRSTEDCLTASATRSKVSPCRRSADSDTSIAISYAGAPAISACVISGRAVSSLRTRSAIVFSAASPAFPEMATSPTWLRAITSRMIGRSVPAGNVAIASTLFRISPIARSASAPSSSSTLTVPPPSAAVARIWRTPSTSRTASSIRMTTPCSTSSGAAPRYGTSMSIRSRSISGNTSSVTPLTANRPLSTNAVISKFAATRLRANQPMPLRMGLS